MAVERPHEVDFDRLRADEGLIVSTVQRAFPGLRRLGARYGLPLGEDGDSLSVYCLDGVWRYKRFSDSSDHGDVLDFVRRYFGARSLPEAVDLIGKLPAPRKVYRQATSRPAEPKEPPAWADPAVAERWILRYEEHPKRYKLWQAYKPLLRATIDRWRFGVGVLPHRIDRQTGERLYPAGCDHQRLIYPVFVGGRCAAIRGRAIDCRCPKWLSAAGSEAEMWGSDLLLPDSRPAVVYVPENPVDAALAMQVKTDALAVASTAGCSTWRDAWAQRIAAARPRLTEVVYDHDLSGGCYREHCPTCRRAFNDWRAKMLARQLDRGQTPVEPNSPVPAVVKVCASLRRAGLSSVRTFEWPKDAPYGADLGWFVSAWMGRADRLGASHAQEQRAT